jgi:hypothetical protein
MYKKGDQSDRYQIENFEIYRTLAKINDEYILKYVPRPIDDPFQNIWFFIIGVASAVVVVGIGFWYYRKTSRSVGTN